MNYLILFLGVYASMMWKLYSTAEGSDRWPFWSLLMIGYTASMMRLCFVIPCFNLNRSISRKTWNDKTLMVFLGSGGHTGEMLRMLSTVKSLDSLKHITFVTSTGDEGSQKMLTKFIEERSLRASYSFVDLPRARRVGEPLVSSFLSTVKSIMFVFNVFPNIEYPPDILMLNGPGTTVPLAIFYTFLNVVQFSHTTKIFYIESLARVNSLSTSGMICRPLAHRFLVQWPKLAVKTSTEYKGILV